MLFRSYARTQLGVLAHYLRLSFWPHPLVADYHDWPVASGIPPAGWIVLALLAVTGWGLWQGKLWSFLGVVFFLVLAPTSSFLPIITEVAAERRMYLPLAAVITAVVLATRRWPRWWIGPVAVACIVGTFQRNEVYQSPHAFWEDVLAKRPGNGRAHTNYANLLMAEGKTAEALKHYRAAVQVSPEIPEIHNNLAYAAFVSGDTVTAERHFREALRLDPSYAVAHVSYARLLAQAGRRDEAIQHQAEAVRLRPDVTDWAKTLAEYQAR